MHAGLASVCFFENARSSAIGREPRFTMCALSGRWANRARAGNGGLQAKSRIHTIGQDQALNYPPVSGHPAEPTLLQHPRKKNGLLVDMNLPALPIQDGKFKFSFPMAA